MTEPTTLKRKVIVIKKLVFSVQLHMKARNNNVREVLYSVTYGKQERPSENSKPNNLQIHQSVPETLLNASLLPFVSATACLNCSRMVFNSEERCKVLCSAMRRRSFKA